MKQWIKSVLYIPKHQKPTDENILRLLLPSLVGIVICMICLAGSTWAWFTANVQTKPQAIAAANYEIEVTIDGGPVAAPISLQVGQIYKITLTAGGTAAKFGGYCKVEGDGKTRYTEQMLPGETLTFTLIPDSDGIYTFTAVWGKYSGEADISSGDTVGQEPAEEETPPSPARLDKGASGQEPGRSEPEPAAPTESAGPTAESESTPAETSDVSTGDGFTAR